MGLAGVVIAPFFKMIVREPVRGGFDAPDRITRPANIGEVARTLLRKPSFWGLSFGGAASSMMGYGLFFWLPSFIVRSYGLSLLDASLYFAAILLIGGVAGIWLGGVLADRFGTARKSAYAIIPAVAFLCTAPFYVAAVLSPSLTIAFVLFLVPVALGLVWLGPVLAAIQQLVPPHMRTTTSAVFLFVNNLIGIGLGSVTLGALSDYLSQHYGADSLRYAILAGTSFYLIAAALFLLSARHLERDWDRHTPQAA